MINYNLVLWVGIAVIVGSFCLFLYLEMKKSKDDRKQWKLNQSFNKGKK